MLSPKPGDMSFCCVPRSGFTPITTLTTPWPRPDPDGMVVLAVHGGIRVNIELGDLKALRDMARRTSNFRDDSLNAPPRNELTAASRRVV